MPLRTTTIEHTTTLTSPPSLVFAIVMSPEAAPLIDPAVREWRADSRPIGVGTRFTIRGRLGWVPIRGTSEVVLWEPKLALWAVTVGTNMAGYTPVFGEEVRFVLLGGQEINPETLLRWYVLHVLFLPFVIVIFMAIHFWRVRKDGGISGPL